MSAMLALYWSLRVRISVWRLLLCLRSFGI